MPLKPDPVKMAVVGLGNWGRNHVRTLDAMPECELAYIFDHSREAMARQLSSTSGARGAESLEQILNDDTVRAVVIATTAPSHHELAREVLRAGKDVFIEKPMALEVEHGEELVGLAAERGLLIGVGHLLLFHPAVVRLKQIIDSGELGETFYAYSQRLNLGVIRQDENALWSLAPHDFSLMNYLLGAAPIDLQAAGGTYLQKNIGDVFFVTLHYPGGKIGHIHVSWLDPQKVRRMTVVGSKKMVVFDDQSPTEKLRMYDKGINQPDFENYGEILQIRSGDIYIPYIDNAEPLKLQAQHFIECVRERKTPRVDGESGLAVVRMLNEASRQINVAQSAREAARL